MSRLSFVVIATLALGANGCSFMFARTPTPQTARVPGACEGRGIAAAVDAGLSVLLAVRVAQPDSNSLLAVRPTSGDVLLRSTWVGRNRDAVEAGMLGAFMLAAGSMTWGIAKTSECSAMRAASPPELLPGRTPAARPVPPTIRAAPAAPPAVAPGAALAAPVPQQSDAE
jgi:hypothetical protein